MPSQTPSSSSSSSSATLPSFPHLLLSIPSPGVCHLQLSRPPVNAINLSLWTSLLAALTHVENLFPITIRVLIISSNSPQNLFSAGNDLLELHVPSTTKSRFFTFYSTQQTFLSRLYKSPLYTIAALRGPTPAAAFVISLSCDYRIAISDTLMGFNEVAIGLAVPSFWATLLVATANHRPNAEHILATGTMLKTADALQLALVNEIVHGGKLDLHKRALQLAKRFADTKDQAVGRANTKLTIRTKFGNDWEEAVWRDTANAWIQLSKEDTIQKLGRVINKLTKKGSPKL